MDRELHQAVLGVYVLKKFLVNYQQPDGQVLVHYFTGERNNCSCLLQQLLVYFWVTICSKSRQMWGKESTYLKGKFPQHLWCTDTEWLQRVAISRYRMPECPWILAAILPTTRAFQQMVSTFSLIVHLTAVFCEVASSPIWLASCLGCWSNFMHFSSVAWVVTESHDIQDRRARCWINTLSFFPMELPVC